MAAAWVRVGARSSAKLWQLRPASRSLLFAAPASRRNYLSPAYACDAEWAESTRNDPLLHNVNLSQLFIDLSRKFTAKTKEDFSVDVDIFVNSAEGKEFHHEVENVVNRLRRSKYTRNTLPSTICGTIRYMLSIGEGERLVEMLLDRYNYGLFPDVHTTNLLLNHFLTSAQELRAAKVATELMLQEEYGNEISRVLSLIACVKYLSAGPNAAPWEKPQPAAPVDEDDDEIVYVRVPNLTNDWFDDHFDLKDPDQLIGKTLVHFSGACAPGVVRDSVRLIGLARRSKWEELRSQIADTKEVSADTKQLCLQRLPPTPAVAESSDQEADAEPSDDAKDSSSDKNPDTAPAQEAAVPDWVGEQLDKIKVNASSLLSLLEKEAQNLSPHEAADIEQQKARFLQFVKGRSDALAAQQAARDRKQRIEALRAKKKELVEKEELYYAFENWNKIEMILAEVEKEAVKEEKVEEYVPPDVRQRRPSQQKA